MRSVAAYYALPSEALLSELLEHRVLWDAVLSPAVRLALLEHFQVLWQVALLLWNWIEDCTLVRQRRRRIIDH